MINLFEKVSKILGEKLEKKGCCIFIESTNVKLHELNFKLTEKFDSSLAEKIFDSICYEEYEAFKAFLIEMECETEHIGRTSSFYIVPENNSASSISLARNFYEYFANRKSFSKLLAEQILREEGYSNDNDFRSFIEDMNFDLKADNSIKLKDRLEQLAEQLANEWADYMKVDNVKKAHEHIEKVKKENFDYSIECYLDNLSIA